MDGVIAGESGGIFVTGGFDEGADAGEDGEDIGASGRFGEVEGGGGEHELDFFVEGDGFEGGLGNGGFGGADEGVAVPRDGEHHPAVAGVGDHDGGIAGEERAIENEESALAGGDEGGGGGVVEVANGVGESACGVDDHASGGGVDLA